MARYELHAIGTEIWYTGDVCNQSGKGVVSAHRHFSDGTGAMDIRLEDGREINAIHMSNFGSHPGRRFWTWADYAADRAAKIEAMRAEFAAMKRAAS